MSTIKTVFGFLGQALERYTPMKLSGDRPEDSFNYQEITDRLSTSGQPNENQLVNIAKAGFTTVINLAPVSKLENSIINEAEILQGEGVEYIHLPVDFENPTEEDYARFLKHMADKSGEQLWVHCAANMRVSAFMYRYRTTELGEAEKEVRADMNEIWEPFGVWRKFIGWE
ncbi:MAG: protein tyrosine phosphatase family protein [Pseudomonadales bacterium]|nr:protein tyrosine phosphatase family protein [Pseudomonadales bacterium]MBO6659052.1 protein tyrosine phosphatase family protein [Pseudomonadales bacterium]